MISANAQVRFGLKSGSKYIRFHGDDAGNLDSKLGFWGGFFLSIKTQKPLIIQPEFTYSVKGAKTHLGSAKITLDYTISTFLFYLNMLFRSTISKISIRLYLLVLLLDLIQEPRQLLIQMGRWKAKIMASVVNREYGIHLVAHWASI